jgi:hypothetical protein
MTTVLQSAAGWHGDGMHGHGVMGPDISLRAPMRMPARVVPTVVSPGAIWVR